MHRRTRVSGVRCYRGVMVKKNSVQQCLKTFKQYTVCFLRFDQLKQIKCISSATFKRISIHFIQHFTCCAVSLNKLLNHAVGLYLGVLIISTVCSEKCVVAYSSVIHYSATECCCIGYT